MTWKSCPSLAKSRQPIKGEISFQCKRCKYCRTCMSLRYDQHISIQFLRISRINIFQFSIIQNSKDICDRQTASDMSECTCLQAFYCLNSDIGCKFFQFIYRHVPILHFYFSIECTISLIASI